MNMREALAGRARWAGREFVCLSGGGNVAVVMGDVRRPSPGPRCRGGVHSTGWAGRSNHAAAKSRLAAHGARRCEQQAGCVGAPGRAPAEHGARVSRYGRRSRLARRCPRPRVGVRAYHTGSQNATRRAKEKVTARNYISRQNTIVQESVQWVPWPGPARRRGRGVSDGGWPPVGGQSTVLPAHSGLPPPFTTEERIRSQQRF